MSNTGRKSRRRPQRKINQNMKEKLLILFGIVLLLLVILVLRITYINATSGSKYKKQVLSQAQQVNSPVTTGMSGDERDIHFEEAGKFIIEKEKASIGMLQRMFKIGFNRAARIMDQLCDAGVVGPEEGTKPRKVLMSMEEFQNYLENQ